MKKYRLILAFFIVYVLFCMVLQPQIYMKECFNGITAWAINVLPSVLPFIFFTKLLSSFVSIEKLSKPFAKPIKRLFGTSPISSYVFLMSIVSGYPVGSKMIADLYDRGQISLADACKMTSFCSNSGPMFIIGAVGAGMLGNAKLGYIIFLSHVLGAILNGIIFKYVFMRKFKNEEKREISSHISLAPSFGDMVTDSALSIISVGAIIAIFFVIIKTLDPLFMFIPQNLRGIFAGFVEITRGCMDISRTCGRFAVVACSGVISFGGLSTLMQSSTMMKKIKMPLWLLFLIKLSHGILACLISLLFVIVI